MQTDHAQNHRGQIRAQDFGVGVFRAGIEVVFGIQADGHARSHTATTACTLARGGLGDFLNVQLFHFGARRIAFHPRQTCVDDKADAWHGERGFGDVGGQYHPPRLACGVENAVLLLRRQAREQRQNVQIAAIAFAQGFSGFAYVFFTRQKHQNIAITEQTQFVHGIDDAIHHGHVFFVFVGLIAKRPVTHFDGEGAA